MELITRAQFTQLLLNGEAQQADPLQLGIERDIHWIADKTLNEYAQEARVARNIVA